MGTLREEAQAYEQKQTKNIVVLEKIPIDIELKDGEGKDNNGEVFKYKYVEVDGSQYRVPSSVIGGIKSILKKMPHIKYVTVDREGTGMSTEYHVMPYINPETEEVKD